MPELPEAETTVRGLEKEILGLKILDVWTDLNTKDKRKNDTVANPKYFFMFQKEIKNRKILSVERRAKNVLIHLSPTPSAFSHSPSGRGRKTILIHMKMTGNLLFGKTDEYEKNKFVHFIFYLSKNNCLAFSDIRKFGKITLLDTKESHNSKHLQNLGPEPLDKNFTLKIFKERLLKKPNVKIKTVLLDQSIIAGIGNIYSDEILWHSSIHPERKVKDITKKEFLKMFQNTKKLLQKGIDFGGDSMSDYRNIYGLKGNFQMHHMAYRRAGEKCKKKNCRGIILRKIINGRSAHFCSVHQI